MPTVLFSTDFSEEDRYPVSQDMVNRLKFLVIIGLASISADRIARIMTQSRERRHVRRHSLDLDLSQIILDEWHKKADSVQVFISGKPKSNRKTRDNIFASIIGASLQRHFQIDLEALLTGKVLSSSALDIISDLDHPYIRSIFFEQKFYNGLKNYGYSILPQLEFRNHDMPTTDEDSDHLTEVGATVEAESLSWEEGIAAFDIYAPLPEPQRPAKIAHFSFLALAEHVREPII